MPTAEIETAEEKTPNQFRVPFHKRHRRLLALLLIPILIPILVLLGLNWRNQRVAQAAEEKASFAMVSYKKGDFKRAVAGLEEATKIKSDDPKTQRALGQSYEATGKLNAAVQAYKDSLAANPNQPEVRYSMAVIYKSQGKLQKAIDALEKAVSQRKNFSAARLSLGDIYAQQGQKDKAHEQYQAVINMKPFGMGMDEAQLASAGQSNLPATVLGTKPAAPDGPDMSFKTTPSITLARKKPGTAYYRWDSSTTAWIPYSGPIRALKWRRTFYYYSADTDGNTETVKSQVITIDQGDGQIVGKSTSSPRKRSGDKAAKGKRSVITKFIRGVNGRSSKPLPLKIIANWGTEGQGDGQFNAPTGVAVDKRGYVYVADGTDRIQKFTANGDFVGKWGTEGFGNGQFRETAAVAVDKRGYVYVADGSDRIQKFTSNGDFVGKWGSGGYASGNLRVTTGVATDKNGYVYVSDWTNGIQKFTSNGKFVSQWGTEETGDDWLDLNYAEAVGIAVDDDGYVYVADYGNSRIMKYTSKGDLVTQWGAPGEGDGQFGSPGGIVVGKNGNIYVADPENNRVQGFTAYGTFIGKWGTEGPGNGQFQEPMGLALSKNDDLYVADQYNHRVQKLTLKW